LDAAAAVNEWRSLSVTLNSNNTPLDAAIASIIQTTLDMPKTVPALSLAVSFTEAALRVCWTQRSRKAHLNLLVVYLNALNAQRVFEHVTAVQASPLYALRYDATTRMSLDAMQVLASVQWGDAFRAREGVHALRKSYAAHPSLPSYLWVIALEARDLSCKQIEVPSPFFGFPSARKETNYFNCFFL
jgi:hypothetical protein